MDDRETTAAPLSEPTRHRRTLLLLGSLLLTASAGGWAFWQVRRHFAGYSTFGSFHKPEWPRTPWKSARLDVEYVGDARCTPCHKEIAETYRLHPMGRSLAPVAASSVPGLTDQPANADVTFDAGAFRYAIQRREGRLWHKESLRGEAGRIIAEVENEVTYALGSGTRGVAYLFEREGRLFQSPIAWYGQKGRWDLSPGYPQRNRHFDRPIEPQCLFCHANQVEPVKLTVNRYKEPIFQGHSIGCERCHGPGGLHVRTQEQVDDRDPTIVNPRHLEPALREAVCEQCHLQGDYRIERPGRSAFDYRPGLPLSTFLTVLDRTSKRGNKAVGHVEQMHSSRCFRESRGALGCISCHDPHQVPSPEEKVSYYRRRCLDCHEQKPCGLAQSERLGRSRDDDCVSCHMPVSSNTDIVHNATTDHRILRKPEAPQPQQAEDMARLHPLEFFHDEGVHTRELAIGLAYEARRPGERRQQARLARMALESLGETLQREPGDLVAWRAKAQALAISGRAKEALQIFDSVLEKAPQYEQALDERVALALELGDKRADPTPALRAVAVNPYSAEFHERLAYYQLENRNWKQAIQEADEALRLNPFLIFARQFRIRCLLHDKDQERAAQEFQILTQLNPGDQRIWRIWFEQEQQKSGR